MAESAHTPLPWHMAEPWAGFSEIRGANGELVCGLAVGVPEERLPADVCKANMMLLERMVKHHERLLAELYSVTMGLNAARLLMDNQVTRDLAGEVVAEARALLAELDQ